LSWRAVADDAHVLCHQGRALRPWSKREVLAPDCQIDCRALDVHRPARADQAQRHRADAGACVLRQLRDQPALRKAWFARDGQRDVVLQRTQLPLRQGQGVERHTHLPGVLAPRLSEMQALAAAPEQGHAELRFERTDVTADGAVREIDLLRGGHQAAALGNREKAEQTRSVGQAHGWVVEFSATKCERLALAIATAHVEHARPSTSGANPCPL
jgi:hypothetical protein